MDLEIWYRFQHMSSTTLRFVSARISIAQRYLQFCATEILRGTLRKNVGYFVDNNVPEYGIALRYHSPEVPGKWQDDAANYSSLARNPTCIVSRERSRLEGGACLITAGERRGGGGERGEGKEGKN